MIKVPRKNFNIQRVMAIYQQIQIAPGMKPATIANRIGLRKDVVYRYLPALGKIALVYEDDKGGLYPCPI